MDQPTAITLKSGAVLELQDPGFEIADDLTCAVLGELARARTNISLKSLDGIDLDPQTGTDLSDIDGPTLDSLKNVVCTVAGSKALRNPIFAAAARCLYNGMKIERSTFEPREARRDFLPVAREVIKYTMGPFFDGLDLRSLLKPDDTAKSPK